MRTLLVAGGVGAFLSLSCSVRNNYETLSFFFDGVPDPNAPPVIVDRFGKQISPESYGEIGAVPPPAGPTGSSHPPFKNRECEGCHIFPKSKVKQPSWTIGAPKLAFPVEELCAKCHEPPQARFVHGPVAMLRCDLCHEAHESRYPNLLRRESINEVCVSCHLDQTFVTQEAHGDLDNRSCSECHDPHAGDNSAFLKPGAPSLWDVLPTDVEEEEQGSEDDKPGGQGS